jgi:transcriptional antiterminator NusG
MIITDESWYVVRNTKGVTGFVGPGSKPVPLSEEEVISMGIDKAIQKIASNNIDVEIGETVKVTEGPFEGFMGSVQEINLEKKKLKVVISMFGGRETPTELEFNQIEKI